MENPEDSEKDEGWVHRSPTSELSSHTSRASCSRDRDEEYRRRSRRSRERCSRGRPSRITRSRSPILPHTRAVTTSASERQERMRERAARSPPRDLVRLITSQGRTSSPSEGLGYRSPSRCRDLRRLYTRSRPGRHPIPSGRRSRSRSRHSHHSRRSATNTVGQGTSHLFDSQTLTDFLNIMKNFAKSDDTPKLHFDKNIIPEFDPTVQHHRIETWLAKVNECSKIYKWTDQQTSHFALPRLVGHAKKWYEGLLTIDRTWLEWQRCLKRAFPSEKNYGTQLSDMLQRRFKIGESLDEYYFDKMLLLNACEISGKRAVDCVIHGIDDMTLKASASSARFTEPEDLLGFLKDICKEPHYKGSRPRPSWTSIICSKCKKAGHHFKQCRTAICYNCKQLGHRTQQCHQPLNKCSVCQKIGHKSEECYRNKISNDKTNSKPSTGKRTLAVETFTSPKNSKFYKDVYINGGTYKIHSFIDFGSDCTLISKELADKYKLVIESENMPLIKGIGETRVLPIGKTKFRLRIGDVEADILAYVVNTEQLHVPILVGQNFTELSHILVIKTNHSLDLINRNTPPEFQNLEPDCDTFKKSIRLIISENSIVNKVGIVPCYTPDFVEGIIFIPGSYRRYSSLEYWIQEGVYQVIEGKTYVFVTSPLSDLILKKDSLLVRAEWVCQVKKVPADTRRCCSINTTNEVIDKSDINVSKDLSDEEMNKVYSLIENYRTTFAQNLSELGCTDLGEMDIQLTDKAPIVYRPYRMSFKERETVQNMVSELIENEIIEESSSSYASPILLVSKKTGGHRLCVDYRALNRLTIKDHFPLPRIEDQIDFLSGSKFFSCLDLMSGYYQIPIAPHCRYLTAFVTPNGLYHFRRMPFGLVNAPAVFQRVITKALNLKASKVDPNNEIGKPAIAYMDDLIIPSKTFEEGYLKLEKTFELMNQANLTLNLKKCNFFQKTINYLGYEISSDGVRPGEIKIEAVKNFPCPKNVHEVRQFIGLASYFRKFVKDFSIIARPLTDLTKKDTLWKWDTDQQNSFDTLKRKLIDRPVLSIFNPKYITELHTDASKVGLAGILLQKENDDAPLKPISYYSRKTTIDEQKFHAYDLETLAVVTSLHRFRVYLLGISFTIITDCNALRATFSKRDILPRIARWWLALQEYDCNVMYRPNHNMAHVDALSRNPISPQPLEPEPDISRILNITQEDWLLSLQLSDPKLCHIREVLKDPNYDDLVDIKQNFVLKGNKLFRKVTENDLRWVVPRGARWEICRRNHDEIGHFSVEKTLSKIKKDFWFPKMKKFITKYVKSCVHCAYGKDVSGKREGFLHPIPKIEVPFHTVHIDHLGPFVRTKYGNMYLLLIVDGFTKFCIIRPLRNLKAALTIRVLNDVFSTFGFPVRLISDRGSTFTAKDFQKFCETSHIKHILNAVASPRANGQVERYNRTVLGALGSYADKLGESKWDQELGKIQWGLNNTLNKGIGKTPSEALFGRNLTHGSENIFEEIHADTRTTQDISDIHSEVVDHIAKDQQQQKLRFDKKRKEPKTYSIGDLVKIKKQINSNDGQSKKLLPVFSGPYKITKILENDRYEVSSIPGSNIGTKKYCNIWAVDQIQPWINTHVHSHSSDTDDCLSD